MINPDKVDIIVRENNLTTSQEKFCMEFVKTGNATDAYRTAYPTSSLATAKVGGGKLRRHGGCIKLISYLKSEIRSNNAIDLDEIINNLRNIEKECREKGKYDQAIEANKQMASIMGYNNRNKGETPPKSTAIQINILPPNNNHNKSNNIIDITTKSGGLSISAPTTSSNNNDSGDIGDSTDTPPQIDSNNSDMGGSDEDELPFDK